MIVRTWIKGRAHYIECNDPDSVVLEVVLEDDRTVQLVVKRDGEISLLGWGNMPAKVGNANSVTFACTLNPAKQTTCPNCYNPFGAKDRCCGKLKDLR